MTMVLTLKNEELKIVRAIELNYIKKKWGLLEKNKLR